MRKWLGENIPHAKKTKHQTYNRDHNCCRHSEGESSEHIYRAEKRNQCERQHYIKWLPKREIKRGMYILGLIL